MKRFTLILLCAFLVTNCSRPLTPKSMTLSESDKKFISICHDDFDIDVTLKRFPDTIWAYIPTETSLIDLKADDKGPILVKEANEALSVKFLDGRFENNQFVIEYDIGPMKTYQKGYGYTTAYSEKIQSLQQKVFSALQQTYFTVDQIPGDIQFDDPDKQQRRDDFVDAHLNAEKLPSFFVLVIADIKTGIELESIFYMDDLRKSLGIAPTITPEEFQKRYVAEIRGHVNIINDTTGKHLNLREITLPYFLARQMVNRINFKYTRSSFPPSDETKKELLTIVKTAVHAYAFDQYEGVLLDDLNLGTQETIEKSELDAYTPDPASSEGKYHHIKFR